MSRNKFSNCASSRFEFSRFFVTFLEIVEFEIVDDENPYLPAIPENLDEDIHGAHDHLEEEKKVEPLRSSAWTTGGGSARHATLQRRYDNGSG